MDEGPNVEYPKQVTIKTIGERAGRSKKKGSIFRGFHGDNRHAAKESEGITQTREKPPRSHPQKRARTRKNKIRLLRGVVKELFSGRESFSRREPTGFIPKRKKPDESSHKKGDFAE